MPAMSAAMNTSHKLMRVSAWLRSEARTEPWEPCAAPPAPVCSSS